jgi:hypothetical protein
MTRTTLLLGALLLLIAPLHAATITLTLDDVPEVECGALFAELECQLHFENTTGEDQTPGYCAFIEDANNFGLAGVYLWPSRLVLDLDNLEGIESVEVDVYETHFAGSTRVFLYGDDGAIDSTASYMEDGQTLTVSTNGEVPTSLAVSAHEAYVWEIRLIGETAAPVEQASFSAVKAIYR